MIYTTEKLLKYLDKFYKENGRPPVENDFTRNSKYPGFCTYIRHFGSWGNALELVFTDEQKYLARIKYNLKDVCGICGVELLYDRHPLRERDNKGNITGRWFCNKCGQKFYQKNNSNSQRNFRKLIADIRTDNLDPNSTIAKGNDYQKLACILYGWEDLNKKNDNYTNPIDCYDPKTGLYHQIKGKSYEKIYNRWQFGHLEIDLYKHYEDMILFCASEDMKIIERIYKLHETEIKKLSSITIGIRNYYSQYRVKNDEEIENANKIWQEIRNDR